MMDRRNEIYLCTENHYDLYMQQCSNTSPLRNMGQIPYHVLNKEKILGNIQEVVNIHFRVHP
jgi:hypothetical protein